MATENRAKYVDGLCKPPGAKFYLYRFMVKGELYTGSTSQEYHKDAKKELERLRKKANHKAKGTLYTPILSEAMADWEKDKKSSNRSEKHLKNVKDSIIHHVIPIVGDIVVDSITSDHITRIRTAYLNKFTANGCNTILRNLKCVLKYASEKHHFDMPKIEFLTVQDKPIIYLTDDKIQSFLDAIDFKGTGYKLNPDISFAARVMIFMGFREDEVLNMRHSLFDNINKKYLLDKTKGDESVYTDIPDEVIEFYKKIPKTKSDFILHQENGQPRCEGYTKKPVRRASIKIGMKFSSHTLRKTHACLIAEAGGTSFEIKEAMRHKSIITSEKYVNITRKAVSNVQNRVWNKIRLASHVL